MKFLKTIRFDGSDDFVFENAAHSDDWAIPGGFMFAHSAPHDLIGKPRQAFRNGFLSLENFGWSTFVSVGDLDSEAFGKIERSLADYFVQNFGAPNEAEAIKAAAAELASTADLCADVPINTIFTVQRDFDDDNNVTEAFRIVDAQRGAVHTRVWELVEE